MTTSLPDLISMRHLIERYDVLLFDAYGVLIDDEGALPYAEKLIEHLTTIEKPYYILTNGSSSSPERTAKRYARFGLPIPSPRVITSGGLVEDWLCQRGYRGQRFMILGPPSCHFMVERCGGKIVPLDASDFDVLIIGNQDGFLFRECIDHVISVLLRAFDAGRDIALLAPNPDLIFPGSQGRYCITGGMMASMIELAINVRFPGLPQRFVRLGKPYAPIFAEARRRAGQARFVMIGDQMITDVKGALAAEMDAVLIGTGLSRIDDAKTYTELRPTYRMQDLAL